VRGFVERFCLRRPAALTCICNTVVDGVASTERPLRLKHNGDEVGAMSREARGRGIGELAAATEANSGEPLAAAGCDSIDRELRQVDAAVEVDRGEVWAMDR
jgi:hypothetical protein